MSRVFKTEDTNYIETLILVALQASIDEANRAGRMSQRAKRNIKALTRCLDDAIASLEQAQRVVRGTA
jgi:hypothetical protein